MVGAGGVRLSVREWGDPGWPTVVLVHGFPDNSSVWDGVVPLLAERFHVVTYDVRGCGESDAPGDVGGYRLELLSGDLAAVIRSVSPDRAVHLVGHDWGSIQSWHAVTDPQVRGLFASFTSISGPCLAHVPYWIRGQVRRLRIRPVVTQLMHSWYTAFFQIPAVPEAAFRIPMMLRRFHARGRDARNGVQLYRANMMNGDGPDERRTDVPVQQIALTKDAFVLQGMLEAAEPWCDRLWRRELPVEHWAPRTHPQPVAEMIGEFIDLLDDKPVPRALRGARVGASTRSFAGKLVLVTGAGSGIGRACALAFAAQGADVLAVDIDEASATVTAAEARKSHVDAAAIRADVTDGAGMAALAKRVADEFGVPDVVHANAGIAVAGPFMATDEDDWRRLLAVNLWGVIHTLKAFAQLQIDRGRGGHLVVTASAAAFTPWPVLSAYSVSKAAVLSMAQSLRTELRPHGIGVSAICPGVVATNLTDNAHFVGQDDATERVTKQRANQRMSRQPKPETVAEAVLDAVRRNRAVVPVTAQGHLAAIAARVSPGALREAGRFVRVGPWETDH